MKKLILEEWLSLDGFAVDKRLPGEPGARRESSGATRHSRRRKEVLSRSRKGVIFFDL